MGTLQNPFPESDPDRRQIWDFLVLEDSREFLRADFSRCRKRFLEQAFYSLDAGGSSNPDEWKVSFGSLEDYAQKWMEDARNMQPELGDLAAAERALLELTNLTEIEIQGDCALARKKFLGPIPLKDGHQLHLQWQTLYWLKRVNGEWRLTGFIGYLPYQGKFRAERT